MASGKFHALKIKLAIDFIQKNLQECIGDTVSWLNEAKTQIFQPTANFEIFKIYLYFVCLPLPASQPASQPACCKTRLH